MVGSRLFSFLSVDFDFVSSSTAPPDSLRRVRDGRSHRRGLRFAPPTIQR
jgi:hypothetical protein